TIHVRVMPVGRLVLHVRHRDRDSARFFFRRVVDRIERAELVLRIVLGQYLGDRRRQRGLAVIDVPDRPDVHMRLAAVKFFLRHGCRISCFLYSEFCLLNSEFCLVTWLPFPELSPRSLPPGSWGLPRTARSAW